MFLISLAKAPCSTQDEATPTYSYDERGLKVRSGSVSKVPEIKAERKQSQSKACASQAPYLPDVCHCSAEKIIQIQ